MSGRCAVVRVTAVLVLGCGAACAPAPRTRPIEGGPVDTGKGTLAAARQYLEGRWTLESFQVFPPGRDAIVLKGQGSLTYDTHGNLQMEIRTDEKSADLLRAAGIEIVDNVISNSGRTVVDMQNRTIAFIAQGQGFASSRSGPLALNRPRYWEVEADRLTLTTKDQDGKPLSVGSWRRMP